MIALFNNKINCFQGDQNRNCIKFLMKTRPLSKDTYFSHHEMKLNNVPLLLIMLNIIDFQHKNKI